MHLPRVTLLGIPVDPLTADEAMARLSHLLIGPMQAHVITPNNEMLVAAAWSPEFADVLRSSTLNLPDSTGLLLAARLTGQKLPQRVTGVDTVETLCRQIGPESPVFLLGAAPGVAEKAAEVLKARNPKLVIAGTHAGSPSDSDAPAILEKIRSSGAVLLLVAFGAPAQDLWIAKHLAEMPSVRVAMGVGGTFDFLAGVQKRAPGWMRSIGLEWLWRFGQEPRRAGRMWRAVVVFPWMVVRYGRLAAGR